MLSGDRQFGMLVLGQARPLQQNLQNRRMDGSRDVPAFELKPAARINDDRRGFGLNAFE